MLSIEECFTTKIGNYVLIKIEHESCVNEPLSQLGSKLVSSFDIITRQRIGAYSLHCNCTKLISTFSQDFLGSRYVIFVHRWNISLYLRNCVFRQDISRNRNSHFQIEFLGKKFKLIYISIWISKNFENYSSQDAFSPDLSRESFNFHESKIVSSTYL